VTFPNWFKISWWLALLVGLGALIGLRFSALAGGKSDAADLVILGIWIMLALAPLFEEITMFGMTLKGKVEKLDKEVDSLRTELRNSVDVRTQISPIFNAPSPPSDSQLPALEARLRGVMTEVLREYNIQQPQARSEIPLVTGDVAVLFAARFHIEKELRRIFSDRLPDQRDRRPMPVFQLARRLAEDGLLDQRLSHVVREVYSVTSPAVHGESVTEAQVAFVRDVAPELIATLRAIGSAGGA